MVRTEVGNSKCKETTSFIVVTFRFFSKPEDARTEVGPRGERRLWGLRSDRKCRRCRSSGRRASSVPLWIGRILRRAAVCNDRIRDSKGNRD
nr:hypothetical protein Iba_scaffold18920CG0140 [Ipomoea batatas]